MGTADELLWYGASRRMRTGSLQKINLQERIQDVLFFL